jgi:hypothetical protein
MRWSGRSILALIIVVSVFALGSCTWLSGPLGFVVVNGQQYALDNMVIDSDGTVAVGEQTLYSFIVVLKSSSVGYSATGVFSGNGNAVTFTLYSPTASLALGTYLAYEDAEYRVEDAHVLGNASFDAGPITAEADMTPDTMDIEIRERLGGVSIVRFILDGPDTGDSGSWMYAEGYFRGVPTTQ